MKIYTSYLKYVLKHDLFNNPEFFPISIMRFKPAWYDGRTPELKQLAPSKALLSDWKAGNITEVEYERRYYSEVLRKYNREDIEEMILDTFPQADGRSVVLYCVCSYDKFCHRKPLGNMYEFKELCSDDIY